MPATDMFWCDRYGVIQDPFGHKWSLATHLRDLTQAEIEAGMKEAFSHAPPQAIRSSVSRQLGALSAGKRLRKNALAKRVGL